jgi:hypothetical protein
MLRITDGGPMVFSKHYGRAARRLATAAALAFSGLGSALAQPPDEIKVWTTVGSDGTVDEADVGKVFFNDSVVQSGQAPVGNQPASDLLEPATDESPASQRTAILPPQTESVVIRYNVAPVDGLLFPPHEACQPGQSGPGVQLVLRYLAAGPSAQVVAKLIEVDLATGLASIRMTFNSSSPDIPAASGYQVQRVAECCPGWRFDFEGKGYYIEATLTRSAFVVSAAGIQMIKIENDSCFG